MRVKTELLRQSARAVGEGRGCGLQRCGPPSPGRPSPAPQPERGRSFPGHLRPPSQARAPRGLPRATAAPQPEGVLRRRRRLPPDPERDSPPVRSPHVCKVHERVGRGERGSRASSPPQRRGDRPEPLHQRHFLHRPAAAAAAATAAAAGPRPEVNALLATPSGGAGPGAPRWRP